MVWSVGEEWTLARMSFSNKTVLSTGKHYWDFLQQILLNIFSLIILNCHFKIFELCPASSWCLMSMCLKLKLNKIVYNSCEIVTDRSEADKADLILFKDHFFSRPSVARDPNQIWMIYMLGKWKDERESNIF